MLMSQSAKLTRKRHVQANSAPARKTALVVAVALMLAACTSAPTVSPTVTVTASPSEPLMSETAPTSVAPTPSASTLAPGEVEPGNYRPFPTWADEATPERVLACRAAEAAFAAQPAPLVLKPNGRTNRVPSIEEYDLAMEAYRKAFKLQQVEFGLNLMWLYWGDMRTMLAAAMSGDPADVKKIVNDQTFIMGGDGKPVDFWAGAELLNNACASVGAVTKFGPLPTRQPPDWFRP